MEIVWAFKGRIDQNQVTDSASCSQSSRWHMVFLLPVDWESPVAPPCPVPVPRLRCDGQCPLTAGSVCSIGQYYFVPPSSPTPCTVIPPVREITAFSGLPPSPITLSRLSLPILSLTPEPRNSALSYCFLLKLYRWHSPGSCSLKEQTAVLESQHFLSPCPPDGMFALTHWCRHSGFLRVAHS